MYLECSVVVVFFASNEGQAEQSFSMLILKCSTDEIICNDQLGSQKINYQYLYDCMFLFPNHSVRMIPDSRQCDLNLLPGQ